MLLYTQEVCWSIIYSNYSDGVFVDVQIDLHSGM